MRLPRCRRPQSIRPPVSSISRPCWRILPESGSLPTGRYVLLVKPRRHIEWGRRSPMLGATPCLLSSALPATTTLMHPILRHRQTGRPSMKKAKLNGTGQSGGAQRGSQPQSPTRRDGKATQRVVKPVLGAEASAELRNRLVAELDHLGSGGRRCIVGASFSW